MARILGGGVFGEMRGKLGSMVFARNRGGAYARQFAKPIDPATIAQLAARNNFGSASSNYHSLDPSTKSLWQNFANSVFNPKNGNMGVASGFNAFVSLLNVVNNVKIATTTLEINGTPAPSTDRDYSFSGTPPTFALEANFQNAGGGANTYSFNSFSNFGITYSGSDADIECDFLLDVTGLVGPSGSVGNFRDANGNYFGFSVFMSNPVDQPGMFVQNPYLIKLFDVKSQTITTPAPGMTDLKVQNLITLDTSKYSAWPQDDQWVQLTLFAQSTTGMLLRIGSEMLQL